MSTFSAMEPVAPTNPTPKSAPRELEIKLVGPRETLRRAMQCPEFKRHTLGRARTQSLHSIYFDTPDERLRRLGLGLRLRKQRKKWIQTVKRERAWYDHDEIEHVVSMAWPSFAPLMDTAIASVFADQEVRSLIAPAFTTEFTRRTRMLDVGNDTLIEVGLDEGQIQAKHLIPLCEMELELKRGDAKALFDLATWLSIKYLLRLEFRSKAERGYALLKDLGDQPARAAVIELPSLTSVDDAFVRIESACLRHLQGNVEGLIFGDDPEYLHQARVAIRRLRAAMSLFNAAVPKSALAAHNAYYKSLGQTLGSARDWDVFLTQLLPALPSDLIDSEGMKAVLQAAVAHRAAEGARARQRLAHSEFTVAMLSFTATLDRRTWRAVSDLEMPQARTLPLSVFAQEVLNRRWRRAVKRAGAMDLTQPATLHALRIELKSLRYGLEFLASLFPRKSTVKFLGMLGDIQEHLGKVNDATTVRSMTDRLRQDCADNASREALGTISGYFAAKAEHEAAIALKTWKRLRQSDPPWK